MKKGFTLAEVLITLAIIGVVAALTIPTVMASYQKHSQYTAFMKMYNTLSNALSLSEVEHGTFNLWTRDNNNISQTFKTNFYPYLKISKICEESKLSSCVSAYDIHMLNGEKMGSTDDEGNTGNGLSVILNDGSWLLTMPADSDIIFMFDTNGANIMGRDIFELIYNVDEQGNSGFDQEYMGSEFCDPNGDEYAQMGIGCPGRLIEKGKMDY